MADIVGSTFSSGSILEFLKGGHLPMNEKYMKELSSKDQSKFQPVTKVNIGYIVSAVIINDQNQVLMMQEAKRSCYGQWYLPAGRMEQGESVVEAVQREVEEETGLTFTPTTLLCVESQGVLWYRFTFTGHVNGGALKTPEQKDKESLQGKWLPVEAVTQPGEEYPLRASDIIPLVQQGIKYRSLKDQPVLSMPLHIPHTKLLNRLFLLTNCFNGDTESLYYMNHKDNTLPMLILPRHCMSSLFSLHQFLKEVFKNYKDLNLHIYGVISLEYSGKDGNDGFCLNLLCGVHDKATNNTLPGVQNQHPTDKAMSSCAGNKFSKNNDGTENNNPNLHSSSGTSQQKSIGSQSTRALPAIQLKDYNWVKIEETESELLECVRVKTGEFGTVPYNLLFM